jgi:chemotaxis protein methyltransferase CheR
LITSSASLDYVRELVYQRAGIVLGVDKNYLIEARLATLARELKLASVEEVVTAARGEQARKLNPRIVEALTTNETTFFRDVHPFNALRDHVIPGLLAARSATEPLRIWSAACSTGQEPYSIAMLLKTHFPSLPSGRVKILGTDVAESILARAREARYRQLEINRGLPAALMVKFFERDGTDWTLESGIRSMVEFNQFNLVTPSTPFPQADIVFLRNVLIYFDEATRGGVLRRVRAALAPDGYLFLGCAETTASVPDMFERVHIGSTVCHRPRNSA